MRGKGQGRKYSEASPDHAGYVKTIANGKERPLTTETSQQMLVEIVGTTRSRVKSFQEIGFADYNGTLKVRGLKVKKRRATPIARGPHRRRTGRVCKLWQCLQSNANGW